MVNKGWVSRQDAARLIKSGIKAASGFKREPSDRRRQGRVKASGTLTSNLGKVLDISCGGLRVLGRKKVEGEGRVELISDTERLLLKGRVVWSHKVGFRKYMMGVEFIDPTPEQLRKLTEISTAA